MKLKHRTELYQTPPNERNDLNYAVSFINNNGSAESVQESGLTIEPLLSSDNHDLHHREVKITVQTHEPPTIPADKQQRSIGKMCCDCFCSKRCLICCEYYMHHWCQKNIQHSS